jgi:hypothetical protein
MNMKALREKFAAITEEQGKELTAAMNAKDISALEAFCKKHGIELAADEKNVAAEYFKTGKLPLSDQELENVAGGCSITTRGLECKCPHCGSFDHYSRDNDLEGTVRVCKKCGRTFVRYSELRED